MLERLDNVHAFRFDVKVGIARQCVDIHFPLTFDLFISCI